jgi:hypothetical protein
LGGHAPAGLHATRRAGAHTTALVHNTRAPGSAALPGRERQTRGLSPD